jgi:hypothetical protein
MEKLTSILVVPNRTTADRALLEKAVALARSVGAQIYLFSCDAELARRLRHSYPIEEAEKAEDSAGMQQPSASGSSVLWQSMFGD